MTTHSRLIMAMLLAAGALILSSPPALARIICNEWGECWRVHEHYTYHPDWGFRPYNWRGREEEPHGWREQEGSGYWRGGQGDGEQD
jgi:hypothetical protein